MIPIQLKISGFLSYRELVTVDFTSFDLACIAGANGAGKSSVLDAMTYALFGKARKTDETIINLQSDSAFVELTFRYETNLYRVQRTNPRGKTTLLEFQIATGHEAGVDTSWKVLTERTVRDTQKKIEDTLRLDYDTFINAAFFLQGNADQFTQQTPSRRKAILGSILGLDVWESYRLKTAGQRRAVENDVKGIDGRLAEINGELAQEAERTQRLKELNAELDRLASARTAQAAVLEAARKVQSRVEEQARLLENLSGQVETTRRRLDQLEKRKLARIEERESFSGIQARESEIRQQYDVLQEKRARLAEWDLASRAHAEKRQQPLGEIQRTRGILEAEQQELERRAAEQEQVVTDLAGLAARVGELQIHLEETRETLEGREALDGEIQAAQQKLAAAQAENPRLRAEMDDLRQRIDQLEAAAEDAAECPVCGQPLSQEHRMQLISDLKVEGTQRGDQYRANLKLLKERDELVGALQAQMAAFRDAEALERRLSAELLPLETRVNSLEEGRRQWLETGAPRLKEVSTQLAEERFAEEARAKLAEIDAELKATGYDAAQHDQVRAAVADAAAVEDELRLLERAAAALAPLTRELEEIEKEAAAAAKELAVQEEAHLNAAAVLAELQADAPDFVEAQRELMNLQEQENQLRMRVGSAQQHVDVLDSLRERKAGLEAEREERTRKIGRYQQLERAFGKDGVPALLIEQAIPQIETRANELLERLSGGEMSVRFQTQRELKSRDDLRETLDITISDGAGTRDYEMYSGGEAFRVNFAIRLALSDVLAHRAGARLQTLVIDEGFGSQDETGRQRLVEAINIVRDDFEKVLVITHIESLKDAFPTRIEVTKTLNGSKIQIVN